MHFCPTFIEGQVHEPDVRREFVGKFWLSAVLACACADPPGSGVAAAGGGGGGLAATSSSGDGGVSAAGATPGAGGVPGAAAGSAGCEFACGGSLGGQSPIGVTTPLGGSAGTASGGGGGTGGGGNAASACRPDQPLCDDFEAYSDGQQPSGRWQAVKTASQGASLVVDSTKAFSGKQSLHVKVDFSGNGGSVNIGTKAGDAAFSAAADTHYARFMLFQTAPQVPGELHARILRLGTMNAPSGSNGTGYSFSLHSYPKPVAIMLESMNDLYVGTRVTPPTDRWVCWEVEYGPGTIGWWQDGQPVSSPVPGSWPKVSLEMLEIGFETFTPVMAELWLDDVVVDTQRIGCPVMQ